MNQFLMQAKPAVDFEGNKQLMDIFRTNSRTGRLGVSGAALTKEGTTTSRAHPRYTRRQIDAAVREPIETRMYDFTSLVGPGNPEVTITTSHDLHGPPWEGNHSRETQRPSTQSLKPITQPKCAYNTQHHRDFERPRKLKNSRSAPGATDMAPTPKVKLLPGMELGHHVRHAHALPGLTRDSFRESETSMMARTLRGSQRL
jgi:hypothetical protein